MFGHEDLKLRMNKSCIGEKYLCNLARWCVVMEFQGGTLVGRQPFTPGNENPIKTWDKSEQLGILACEQSSIEATSSPPW